MCAYLVGEEGREGEGKEGEGEGRGGEGMGVSIWAPPLQNVLLRPCFALLKGRTAISLF